MAQKPDLCIDRLFCFVCFDEPSAAIAQFSMPFSPVNAAISFQLSKSQSRRVQAPIGGAHLLLQPQPRRLDPRLLDALLLELNHLAGLEKALQSYLWRTENINSLEPITSLIFTSLRVEPIGIPRNWLWPDVARRTAYGRRRFQCLGRRPDGSSD